ncbi:MAG: RNA polymerase sigma factor [Planctomycetes bacterium]|nr:RNA polymerase sigma factor [Planctomycetota bacterium]
MVILRSIDQDDVVRLVRTHQAEVWRYVRYLGATAELADDLVQDAFLQLLRAPFVERSPAETAAWLRTVVRNGYVKSLRRPPFEAAELDTIEATWHGFAGDRDDDGGGGAGDGGDASLRALRGCLDTLDGRARQVVRWHYEERRSRQDIGERLGLGLDGVKSLLRRTRAILRRCLERRRGEVSA